jgi:hypothetical protein
MPFVSTYTYQNMVDLVQRLVKGIPVSDIDEVVVDQIDAMIWNIYPWSWTRNQLIAIPLTDGVQDYAYTNEDLYRVLTPRITDKTTGPPYKYRDLRMTRWLEPSTTQKLAWPGFQLMCWDRSHDQFRLESAASVPGSTLLYIEGEYQFQHVKVEDLSDVCVFPDWYAQIFTEGLLWMLYRFADDKRAGSWMVVGGRYQATGQLGTFMAALQQAIDNEESGVGDTIYPEDSIGGSAFQSLPTMFNM